MPKPSETEWEKLVKFALEYEFADVSNYMMMVPYADWMTELMDGPNAEMFSTTDIVNINEILVSAFEHAHGRQLSYWIRRNLIYN